MRPRPPTHSPSRTRRFATLGAVFVATLLGAGLTGAQPSSDATPQGVRAATFADATRRPERTLSAPCQGRDDTALLQTALNALAPGETLKLPAGTCRYSAVLRLDRKRDVEVVGAGREETRLVATDPDRSALVVYDSAQVLIRDLGIRGERSRDRIDHGEARGVYVDRSRDLTLQRLRIDSVAGGGIVLWRVQGARILANEVFDNLSDGIHVTGGSRDILIEGNSARGNGDDSFASIGYLADLDRFGLNERITIRGNRSVGSYASGVSVEGSSDVTVSGNVIEASGMAGIRIASIGSVFNTAGVHGVRVVDNTLRRVKTRSKEDHAALMVIADSASLHGIRVTGNRIEEPLGKYAIRLRGSVARNLTLRDITVQDNDIRDPSGRLRGCVTVGEAVSGLSASGNQLNGRACP